MPDLVSYAAIKDYLQLPNDDNETAITELLEDVEASLEAECDREAFPVQALQLAVAEWHDGTGTQRIRTHFPITTLTSITLGRDSADPVETLTVTDVDVVSFTTGIEGAGRITRTDGGKFGAHRSPRYVLITYDAAAFLPKLAVIAVKRVAAAYVRQFGSEGFKSFKVLDAGGSLERIMESTPEWSRAVERYRRIVLV